MRLSRHKFSREVALDVWNPRHHPQIEALTLAWFDPVAQALENCLGTPVYNIMREDRPKTYARNGRRPSAAPYNTLRDRISSPASPERPPIVFPGRPDVKNIRNPKPDPTDRSSSSDNPLYSYLDGKKSARTTSRDAWRASNVQAPDRDFTQTRECSQLPPARQRERDSPADGLSIRGHGEVANAFNIRGASSTSVTIKNLAPGTTEADVCHILNRQIGEVESCTTFHVRGGLSTTAEVKFGSRVAADNAIRTFHGVLADSELMFGSMTIY